MLADELKIAIRGDVETDVAALSAASRDYSVFTVRPEAVVHPKDADDVASLVRFASARAKAKGKKKITLTGRSAGTDMSGGPLTESVVVSFTRHMNRILEVGTVPAEASAEAGGYGIAEPGVYFRDFERAIDKQGLFFPSYPASKDLCAIGGIVSNNSGGEKTLAYGKTAKYVAEVDMVLADGEMHTIRPLAGAALKKKLAERTFEGRLYKKLYALIEKHYDAIQAARPNVSKNSAGFALWDVWDKKTFDLTKLFTGAQGTLGLLTRAKLNLLKKKRHTRLAVVFLRDFAPLNAVIDVVMRAKPESFESYDDKTMRVALRFLPDLVRSMKTGIISLGLQFLPELWMTVRSGGMPKLILLVELADDDEARLGRCMADLMAALRPLPIVARVVKNAREREKYWTVRRQSFALLHKHSTDKSTVPFVDDFAVRPEHIAEILPQVNAILDRHKDKFVYTIAGHVGDGNFHIIPLADLRDPEVHRLMLSLSEEIYALVLKYGGTITAEHNDGLIRTPFLRKEFGDLICGLFEEVEKICDPLGIFNPGKKTGESREYAAAHVSRENA